MQAERNQLPPVLRALRGQRVRMALRLRFTGAVLMWIFLWACVLALAYAVWRLTIRVERYEERTTIRNHGGDR